MASAKQKSDVDRLKRIVDSLSTALAELDAVARDTRANNPVLRYLMTQAHEQAMNAYRTEYVGVYNRLPEAQS